jgi:plastocyanin
MSFPFNKHALRLAAPLFIVAALIAVAGCGSTSAASTGANTPTIAPTDTVAPTNTTGTGSSGNVVNVSNFQFSPATLTVMAGTTVTWKGASGTHTVTSDPDSPMAFDQAVSQGGTATVAFANPGTYKYHCSIHASMHGTIIVSA